MKNKLLKIAAVAVMALLLVAFMTEPSAAQCAMCKASAEANLKAGGGDPNGLNAGILYILSLPYLLVLGIGLWWWNNRKKERLEAAEINEGDL